MEPGSERPLAESVTQTVGSPMIQVFIRVTDAVFSFLRPATASMVDKGLPQLLIALDDSGTRTRLRRVASSVEVRLLPVGGWPVTAWLRLRSTVKTVLRDWQDIPVLHLHGFISSVLGMSAVRALGFGAPLYFSPHSSRVLGSLRLAGRHS